MSKYSHYEMCEKIFGSRYKFDKVKELVPYSRTDMWDKMIELQEKLSLTEKALELAVADKCKFENAWLKEFLKVDDAKMVVPKKEQWYLEQAQKEMKLAEKEKEIEKWKTKWCESETNSLRLYEQSQNNKQDKISFAVEQLEKVLPSIKATIELAESRYQMKDQVDIIIDNQINQLEGEKL